MAAIRLGSLSGDIKGDSMQTKHMIILINALFILAWMFGFFGKITFPILSAAIFAAIGLGLHWYKNIMINRVMLIAYISTLVTILSGVIVYHMDLLLPLYFLPLLLYVLAVSIGIYTTFWTDAGFIGVEGKNKKAIKKASLVLLGVIVISPPFIMNVLFYEFPRNLTALLVFVLIYEMARRYAVDAQHSDKIE